MVLAHPHLPHGKPRSSEGTQQLMTGVEKALQPWPRRCPHREHPTDQRQWAAMGGELGTGQAGPGLPEGRQMAVPPPLMLQISQAGADAFGRGWRRGQQQGHIAHHTPLER